MSTLSAAAYVASTPLLYAAAFPFGLLGPFTALTLVRVNERLLTISDDEVRRDGGEEVRELLAKWARRHAVRSAMASIGFGISMLAVSRKMAM